MTVQNDRDLARPSASETLSNLDAQQLFRNLIDRIDASGNRQDGAYQLLSQIALGQNPWTFTETPKVVDTTGTVASPGTVLIDTPPDKRICVVDLYVSLDGATDMKFVDDDGTDILGPMYAPNAGQGFVRNYPHGIVLGKGKRLLYTNSAAVDHGIEVNYALI